MNKFHINTRKIKKKLKKTAPGLDLKEDLEGIPNFLRQAALERHKKDVVEKES